MDDRLSVINKLIVAVYCDILTIESTHLKASRFMDVSVAEVHAVEAVGLHDRRTMSEIAKKLRITAGTLTVAVQNLVKKGYVERFRDENDRRVVKIGLTKKGRVLYRAHRMFHIQASRESVDGLTEPEIKALMSALTKVHRFLVDKYINIVDIDLGEDS